MLGTQPFGSGIDSSAPPKIRTEVLRPRTSGASQKMRHSIEAKGLETKDNTSCARESTKDKSISFGGQVPAISLLTSPATVEADTRPEVTNVVLSTRPDTAPNCESSGQSSFRRHYQSLAINGLGHSRSDTSGTNDTAALRDEIRRLQLALVDKFRGRNKMTGGSQFRIGNQRGRDVEAKCKECAGLRNQIKGTKREYGELRNFTNGLEKQLAAEVRLRAEQEKEMSDRMIAWGVERKSMLLQLQKSAKTDDQIERETKKVGDDPYRELNILKKQLLDSRAVNVKVEQELIILRTEAVEARKVFENQERLWGAERTQLVVDLAEIKRRNDCSDKRSDATTEQYMISYKESLKNAESLRDKFRAEAEQLRHDLKAKGSRHDNLLKNLRDLEEKFKFEKEKYTISATRAATAENEVLDLVNKLGKAKSLLDSQTGEISKLREQCEATTKCLTEAEEDVATIKYTMQTCESTIVTLKDTQKILRSKLDENEEMMQDLRRQLQGKKDELYRLKTERDSEITAREDMAAALSIREKQIEMQMKAHKHALEAALNSVVRLCVVAPTVNVHMGRLVEEVVIQRLSPQ